MLNSLLNNVLRQELCIGFIVVFIDPGREGRQSHLLVIEVFSFTLNETFTKL